MLKRKALVRETQLGSPDSRVTFVTSRQHVSELFAKSLILCKLTFAAAPYEIVRHPTA
jgi:hypothetical protein